MSVRDASIRPSNESMGDLLIRVVTLALENATRGELPFGALVFHRGAVAGTGVNTALRDHDPTAHAELTALRAACRSLSTLQLSGATLVSSCEPCAMCHAAAVIADVARIIYAAPKEAVPDLGVPFPQAATELQAVWRRVGSDLLEYVPTTGAEEPFARYLTGAGGAL
jgi:guanine deaminase